MGVVQGGQIPKIPSIPLKIALPKTKTPRYYAPCTSKNLIIKRASGSWVGVWGLGTFSTQPDNLGSVAVYREGLRPLELGLGICEPCQ